MRLALKIPVHPAEEDRQRLNNAMTAYRGALRQAAAMLEIASSAGAEIKPSKTGELMIIEDFAKTNAMLSEVFGKTGKALGYPMRAWLVEKMGLRSEWADSALRDLAVRWMAKDPEMTKLRRNFLVLNGKRKPPLFRFQSFPIRARSAELSDHAINFDLGGEFGEITLKIGTLDPGARRVWKLIVDGEYHGGDMKLVKRRNGGWRLVCPYERMEAPDATTKEAVLEVEVTPECVKAGSLELRFDPILPWLDRLALRQKDLEAERDNCQGFRKARAAIVARCNRLTETRDNGVRTWNHVWAKRIVDHARARACGTICLKEPKEEGLSGRPWQWADLKSKIGYKAKLQGLGFTQRPA